MRKRINHHVVLVVLAGVIASLVSCSDNGGDAALRAGPVRLLDDEGFIEQARHVFDPREYKTDVPLSLRQLDSDSIYFMADSPSGCNPRINIPTSERPPELYIEDIRIEQAASTAELAEMDAGWAFSSEVELPSFNRLTPGNYANVNIPVKLEAEPVRLFFSNVKRGTTIQVYLEKELIHQAKGSGGVEITLPPNVMTIGNNTLNITALNDQESGLIAEYKKAVVGKYGKILIKPGGELEIDDGMTAQFSFGSLPDDRLVTAHFIINSNALDTSTFPHESPIFKARFINLERNYDRVMRSVAICPGDSFVYTAKLPDLEPSLSFSCGYNRGEKELRSSLNVTVADVDNPELTRKYSVSLHRIGRLLWYDYKLDLAEFAGSSVRVSFSYDTGGKEEKGVFIGEPILSFNSRKEGDKRKNVLLISLDTLRGDRVSGSGYQRLTTPAIDALMQKGRSYSMARSLTSWTLPSHKTMLTGFHHLYINYLSGRLNEKKPLTPSLPALPAYMKNAGYRTFAVSGRAYLSPEFGFSNDFDDFHEFHFSFGLGLVEGDIVRCYKEQGWRPAIEFLRENGREAPWFLFLHTYNPHMPYSTMGFEEFWKEEGDTSNRHPDLRVQPPRDFGKKLKENVNDIYDRNLRRSDLQLKLFLSQLEELGMLENTIIVITSDHGEQLGEKEVLANHGELWETVTRVPLVIIDGEQVSGEMDGSVANLMDIVPTILDLAGLDIPEYLPGSSLVNRQEPRPTLLSLFSHRDELAIISDEMKYYNRKDQQLLFNLEDDPAEENPLDLAEENNKQAATNLRHMLYTAAAGEIPGWNIYLTGNDPARLRVRCLELDVGDTWPTKRYRVNLSGGDIFVNHLTFESSGKAALNTLELKEEKPFQLVIEKWDDTKEAWAKFQGTVHIIGREAVDYTGPLVIAPELKTETPGLISMAEMADSADVLVWFTRKPFTSSGIEISEGLTEGDLEALRNLGYLQ